MLRPGHNDRALLDRVDNLAPHLKDYFDKYRDIAIHRKVGFNGPDPLLETLAAHDRMTGVTREPFETEILLLLDVMDRGARASSEKPPQASDKTKGKPKRGNLR